MPLRRLKLLAVIPLVVGTVIPDLVRILPDSVLYRIPGFWRLPGSHSVSGIWLVDLPFGYAMLWALVVLRTPLLSPLWEPHRTFVRAAFDELLRRRYWYLIAVPSILIGTLTHLGWDAFTHEGHFVNTHAATLRNDLFPGDDHPLPIYRVLQYASSVFGMAAIAYWYWSSLEKHLAQRTGYARVRRNSGSKWKKVFLIVAAAASLAVGLAAAYQSDNTSFYDTLSVVSKSAIVVFGFLYVIAGLALGAANLLGASRSIQSD